MARFLVIRFSAIGDVAMTIPVVYSFAKQYPEHHITVLSRDMLEPLFRERPSNVDFLGVDIKNEYEGIAGLNRLYKRLNAMGFDYVVDLNSVFRSLYLSVRFMLVGKSVSVLHKNKYGQWKLTRRLNKKQVIQPSGFQLYRDAFIRLGFSFKLCFTSIFEGKQVDKHNVVTAFGTKGTDKWIGIAPFAKHRGKTYPLELQEKVIARLANRQETRIFLFGGGELEQKTFLDWKNKYPSISVVAGSLTMYDELVLMETLDAMISMDSANMHFASLVGTQVVSVWGQTHPHSGFLGWHQKKENTVEIPLTCRPCSSHGTKPCYKHTWECLYGIHPDRIVEKVETLLK